MNKQFLKLLYQQWFEAERLVMDLSDIKDFDSEQSSRHHTKELQLAKAAEAQCVANIDNYLNLHK